MTHYWVNRLERQQVSYIWMTTRRAPPAVVARDLLPVSFRNPRNRCDRPGANEYDIGALHQLRAVESPRSATWRGQPQLFECPYVCWKG
jgi:hypothetical protein